ncbi:MAG: HlyD family efflux transporter periplasmic adaptor subunit [Isosphaeraceae bacterium]
MTCQRKQLWLAACLVAILGSPAARAQAPATSAKVDTQPLALVPAERYRISTELLPVRSVTLVAAADGIVRSQDARAGATVRPNQEVAQLDKVEAAARLKIAQAEVKEYQATLAIAKAQPTGEFSVPVEQARLEAAQARVELAQAELDRCTLRAPFAGRILASYVSDGQFVSKGTVIAELADVSSLRALVPVIRGGVSAGSSLKVTVEGRPATGQVVALLPLTDSLAVLRELSVPMTAAWITVPNTDGSIEPGERVLSGDLPLTPLAVVPSQSLLNADGKQGPTSVQVIRNEYVANVPVRVLGRPLPDRVQVTGAFRPTDALIVSTSVPLLAGTLIRFAERGGANGVEGVAPNPNVSGTSAELAPPQGAPGSGPAPIGSPGSALPRTRTPTRPAATAPAPAGVPTPANPAAGNVPF